LQTWCLFFDHLRQHPRPALPETQRPAPGLPQLPHKQEIQQADDDDERNHLGRNRGQQGLRRLFREHLGLAQPLVGGLGHPPRRAEVTPRTGRLPPALPDNDHPVTPATWIRPNHRRLARLAIDIPRFRPLHDILNGQDFRIRRRLVGEPQQGQHRRHQCEPEEQHLRLKTFRRQVLQGATGLLVV
jgi:hypothetical protein